MATIANDPSARSPNRFFIQMKLGIKWTAATKDMEDSGRSKFAGRRIVTKPKYVLAEKLRMSGQGHRGVWVDHAGYR